MITAVKLFIFYVCALTVASGHACTHAHADYKKENAEPSPSTEASNTV
jgi:hypothetical protein